MKKIPEAPFPHFDSDSERVRHDQAIGRKTLVGLRALIIQWPALL